MNDKIANDLSEAGWSVCADYFPSGLIAALLLDLEARQAQGLMKPAEVGRGAGQQVQSDIRNDMTQWLSGENDAQREYLDIMASLQADLNRSLFLGLAEFEAHYAQYEAGGFYKRHVDALKGARNRIVSSVTYLTPDWQDSDAGHLVLYDDAERELTRILPHAGTLAVFMSEDIPHEVLPPARTRRSIAGWFRCRAE